MKTLFVITFLNGNTVDVTIDNGSITMDGWTINLTWSLEEQKAFVNWYLCALEDAQAIEEWEYSRLGAVLKTVA